MLISGLFSLIIYKGVTSEVESRFRSIESRVRIEERMRIFPEPPSPFLEEHLEAVKRQMLIMLLFTNGVILILSGAAGYFLASKTLKPIEDALEEQSRFIADASHELRTPLTALKASTEVALRDKKLSAKDARLALESNLEDVNGLQVLADDLLSLAQYEKGYEDFIFEKANIREIIDNAQRKTRSLAKKKNIEVASDVQEAILVAHKQSLKKLVRILLDNALKYTQKDGKVFITTKQDKAHLLIEVRDSGIGISKEDLSHIFDRFYRVDQSRSKTKVPGYGLGLSIAKEIVDLHKGSINVSSVQNKGTTFTIKLPIKHI